MPNIRARAADDKQEAAILSKIVPVILSQNHYEETYDLNGWTKLKTGLAIYKTIWDKNKLHGLGDISIVRRSVLNLFWQPGITDIQDSKMIFDVEMVDRETLMDEFPQLEESSLHSTVKIEKLPTEDYVPEDEDVAVIDVYYKRRGKLHYAKYVGETVLYATENDNEILSTETDPITGEITRVHTMAADGLYDHGLYPYVFDVLHPLDDTPAGFGYVDVSANAMTRIDILTQTLLEGTREETTKRYFAQNDGGINEQEFLNLKKKIIHVPRLDQNYLLPVETPQVTPAHISALSSMIQELRETTGNTEAGNGIAQSGVTAASAYAALQEASGKTSRDATLTSYRAYEKVVYQVIELIRQKYDLPRQFRIVGDMGEEQYISFTNAKMRPQYQGNIGGVDLGFRVPEYDIDVVPEKRSSYSKISQNEFALQLYGSGFFNPQVADQSLTALELMDFDSKDELMQKIAMNGTLFTNLRQWQQLCMELAVRFAPEMVEGLSQAITGQTAPMTGPVQAKPNLDKENPEQTFMKNARERAATAAQPGGATK